MNRMIRSMVSVSLLVVGTASCAQSESSSVSKTDQKEKRVVLSQSGLDVVEQRYGKKDDIKAPIASSFEAIQEMIGTGCDSDTQCKVIGVGNRPCGGFAQFLVYSTADTDEKKLKSQVAIYNGMQKLDNSKKGMVGICQHLSPPKAYCSVKQCVASLNGRATELK